MNRAAGDEAFWDRPIVWLILEKIVLAGVVPALILLGANPMGFDGKQRISAAIAVVAIGCFVAFTIEKRGSGSASTPLSSPAQKIEQKAEDSNCSNVIAGSDAKIDCPSEQENGSANKHPKSP